MTREQRERAARRLLPLVAPYAAKAAKAFAAMDWHWGDPGGGDWRVPTDAEIAVTLCELITEAARNASGDCSTGRLAAWIKPDEAGFGITDEECVYYEDEPEEAA